MALPRYRWLLPTCHLLVDGIALGVWLMHTNAYLRQEKSDFSRPAVVRPVMLLQEEGAITFEPRYISPPPDFLFLALGNVPAAVVSMALRPEAHIQTRKKLWDPAWFLIHEGVSMPLWFCIGVWLDSGTLRIKKVMLTYLSGRIGFVGLMLVPGFARLGGNLELLFWMGLGLYALVVGARWAIQRFGLHHATAPPQP